jgi:hypothetical protein
MVVSDTVCRRPWVLEGEPPLEQDCQLIEDLGPVPDGPGPFLGHVPMGQIEIPLAEMRCCQMLWISR